MKILSSSQNPEIKNLVKIKSDSKTENKFLAEGIRINSGLINSGLNLIQLYCTQQMQNEALQLTNENKITLVSDQIMKKISTAVTPSGIVCLFQKSKEVSKEKLSSGIVLANISDPGNMGTLIRSAAAMGVKSVVIIEGTNPWNSKVIQASAGTIGMVNIFQWTWSELVQNKKNLKLCALVVSDGKVPNQIDFNEILLVIGNEAQGIPQEWINKCDLKMTIPMQQNVESLNAAVAGSIAMYLAFK